MTTVGDARRPAPRPTLVDEDPRDILARALASVQDRLTANDIELAEARHALARLRDPHERPQAEVARVTLEVASSLVKDLVATTTGPMRQLIMTLSVGATPQDAEVDAFTREVIAGGRQQLSVYDSQLLEQPEAMAGAAAYRQVGEEQRVVDDVPTEFAVYGEEAVVCVETWGDPSSDYVLVRDPMLVAVFIAYFDEVWARGLPMPSGRGSEDDDEQLLDLLARGFKDEAIARYLGWSLRTVRRRVARLMEELGARTRFQLGAQAVRSGRLVEGAPRPGALPGARLGRPPTSR